MLRAIDAPNWTFGEAASGRASAHVPMGLLTRTAYARCMSPAAVIQIVVKLSLALAVFAIGLRSRTGDATWLLRRPGLLARSLVSINVIVPLIALWIVQAFGLRPAVEVALVAFAISPVPPVLPNQTDKAGGQSTYAIGLLGVVSIAAIVLVPASVWLLATLLGATFRVSFGTVASLMLQTVVVPLAIGEALRTVAPHAAARAARPVSILGMLILAAAFVLIVAEAWPEMRAQLGNGTFVAIVLVTAAALLVGHLLGGPDAATRPVLAIATAVRHPAIAITIAQATHPGDKAVSAAVLLQFVVAAIASLPYVKRTKRLLDQRVHPSSSSPAAHRDAA